ncbi:MAG: hypothetical protein M1118_11375 [Chloroflexi bacterium]|nr:hypothetical protein [Chloroflexota bacterium]
MAAHRCYHRISPLAERTRDAGSAMAVWQVIQVLSDLVDIVSSTTQSGFVLIWTDRDRLTTIAGVTALR